MFRLQWTVLTDARFNVNDTDSNSERAMLRSKDTSQLVQFWSHWRVSQHLMTWMLRHAQNGPEVLISTHMKTFWCAISKRVLFIRLSTHVVNRTTMWCNILVPAYRPACNTVTVLTELHLFQLLSSRRRKTVQMFTSRTHIYNLLLNTILYFGLKWFICYVHKTTPRKFW